MSKSAKLLPWASWDEWSAVRGLLFSGNANLVRRGLDIVAAWRCRGKVPHAVECSANVLQIQLSDETKTGQGRASVAELRMMYSMTLIRAVNGLLDPEQKKSRAQSIMDLAVKIGLPRHLVDVRHDATHQETPPLGVLRTSAADCLQWFFDNYWNKQEEAKSLSQLMDDTRKALRVYTKKVQQADAAGEEVDLDAVSPHLQSVEVSASPRTLHAVAQVLLGDGFMVPRTSTEKKRKKMSKLGSDADSLKSMRRKDRLLWAEEKIDKMSRGWSVAFQRFQMRWGSFSSTLLVEAISSLVETADSHSSAGTHRNSYLLAWICHLLGPNSVARRHKNDEDSHAAFFLECAARMCAVKMNVWTRIVLEEVMHHLRGIDNELANKIENILEADAIMSGEAVVRVPANAPKSIAEMENAINELEQRRKKQKTGLSTPASNKKSAWVLVDSWVPTPIGLCPGVAEPAVSALSTTTPKGVTAEEPEPIHLFSLQRGQVCSTGVADDVMSNGHVGMGAEVLSNIVEKARWSSSEISALKAKVVLL